MDIGAIFPNTNVSPANEVGRDFSVDASMGIEAALKSIPNQWMINPIGGALSLLLESGNNKYGKPISEEDWKKSEWYRAEGQWGGKGIKYEKGMTDQQASILANAYDTNHYLGNIVAHGGIPGKATEFASQFLSPFNYLLPDASLFTKAAEEGTAITSGMTMAGRLSARLAEMEAKHPGIFPSMAAHGASMGLGTAMLQPLVSLDNPDDYNAMTAFVNVGEGVAQGVGFGAFGHLWRTSTGFGKKIEIQRTALAQILSDKPVDIPASEWSEYRAPNILARRRASEARDVMIEDYRSDLQNLQFDENYKKAEFLDNNIRKIEDILSRNEDEIKKSYREETQTATEEARIADRKMEEARMHEGVKFGEERGTDWKATLEEWTQRSEEAHANIAEIESKYQDFPIPSEQLKEVFPDMAEGSTMKVSELNQRLEDMKNETAYRKTPLDFSTIEYPEQRYIPVEKSTDPTIMEIRNKASQIQGGENLSKSDKLDKSLVDVQEKIKKLKTDMEKTMEAAKVEKSQEVVDAEAAVEKAKAMGPVSEMLSDCLGT